MSWGNTKQPCGPHLEIRVQSRIHLSVFSSTLHPLTLSLISISNIHQIYNIIRAHCPLCRFLFPLLCYGYRYEGLPLLLLRLLPLGPDQLLLNPTTGFLPNELSCWHEYCISWSLRRQCMLLIIIKILLHLPGHIAHTKYTYCSEVQQIGQKIRSELEPLNVLQA